MKNIRQALRPSAGASQKDYLPSLQMRSPNSRSHLFDAAVEFFARLRTNEKRRTRCPEFLEIHPLVHRDTTPKLFGGNENVLRRQSNASSSGRLLVALHQRLEEFFRGFLQEFGLLEH